MKYKAIFFDMDGTLLPMDMDLFNKMYFRELSKKLSKYGIEPAHLVDSVWAGTGGMMKNDGVRSNREVFWEIFAEKTGLDPDEVDRDCLDFYVNEFNEVKASCGDNPRAREAVTVAHEKVPIVVLATSPIFPRDGQITRMKWIGLTPEDFSLVTSYETDSYCKPNPMYFKSICGRVGVNPSEVLMIGNDELEDMYAASMAGIDCYLVTDWMLPDEKHPWNGPRGTFDEMLEMLKNL